jgi:DNA-binding NarL/FixJ family response regulator
MFSGPFNRKGTEMRVFLCGLPPVLAFGMRELFRDTYEVVEVNARFEGAIQGILIFCGVSAREIAEWLLLCNAEPHSLRIIAWGNYTPAAAASLVGMGIRAVLNLSASCDAVRQCVDQVASGNIWVEDFMIPSSVDGSKVRLTPRERQVLDCVARRMRNREIANELKIKTGTVKIHVKNILKKVGGGRSRYRVGLARFTGKI